MTQFNNLQYQEKSKIIFNNLNYYFLLDDNPSLSEFHNEIKFLFDIPNDIDILWINLYHYDLYNDCIESNLLKIKTQLYSDTQVLILNLFGFHMPPNIDQIRNLNSFANSISNPVLFCTGSIGWWTPDAPISFSLSQALYFEFESLVNYQTRKSYKPQLTKYNLQNIKKSKKFLFIGTKDYPNRKYLLSQIIHNNLLDQGYVSYKQIISNNLNSNSYSTDEINEIESVANSIDHLLPLPVLDDTIEYLFMPEIFLFDSYVNMITDTFFDTPTNILFLSEKVFNAIAYGQIFIMMAPAYSLKFLKSQGYQTFSPWVDESYDNIENNYLRIKAVTEAFINFISQPIEVIEKIYIECLPIIQHNHNLLLNSKFTTTLENDIRLAISKKLDNLSTPL